VNETNWTPDITMPDPIDFDTAPIEQVRDEVARMTGWIEDKDGFLNGWEHPEHGMRFVGCRYGDHPIPPALDTIVEILPERVSWALTKYADGRTLFEAWAIGIAWRSWSDTESPEHTALRCLAKVLRAEGERIKESTSCPSPSPSSPPPPVS
jgi:hypothetical protein